MAGEKGIAQIVFTILMFSDSRCLGVIWWRRLQTFTRLEVCTRNLSGIKLTTASCAATYGQNCLDRRRRGPASTFVKDNDI